MELSGLLVLLFSLFINNVLSQENPIDVTPKSVTAKVGDKPEFMCDTKANASFLISNPVQWERHGRDGSKEIISKLANVEAGVSTEYNVELITSNGNMAFKLKLLQGIKADYDGYFKCILYKSSVILAQDEVEVNVIKMFDSMQFKLGDHTLKNADNPAVDVRLEAGTYTSLCKVEGSNPPATVQIFLNDEEQVGTITQLKDTDRTNPPQAFNVQNEMSLTLDINRHNGNILKCVAMVHNEETMKKTMSFSLQIFTVDPEIECKNTSSVNGNKFVLLECLIKLAGVDCSDTFLWENGNTGEQFKLQTNPNQNNYEVLCTQVDSATMTTKLRINQVGTNDFKTDYFVIYVNKHGSTKKGLAELFEAFTGAASSIQFCLYMLCSALTAVILLR